MRRQALVAIAAVLACGSGTALAQGGDLAGVTLRVLDDLADIDTVVLALDAGGDGAEAAESDDRDAAPAAGRDPLRDAAGERRDLRRERDELHDRDLDERSEGRLEDRDVARRTDPPPEPPADAP